MIVIVILISLKIIIIEAFTFIWIVYLVCVVHVFLHLDIWWVCAACLGSRMIFVTVSKRLFRMHLCVCVLGDWMSLLFWVRFIILSSCGVVSVFCLCVCRVCVSVVTWLRFLLLRVVCVGVVQPKSTPDEKNETNPQKSTKRHKHPKK